MKTVDETPTTLQIVGFNTFKEALAEANERMIHRFFICTAIFYCLLVAAQWLAAGGTFSKDNTDAPGSRSGLSLHVDNLTGCEYLSTISGGLHPRLDFEGNHVGCKY